MKYNNPIVQAAVDKYIKQKHKLTDEEFLQVKIASSMDYIRYLEESIQRDMNLIETVVNYAKRSKENLLNEQEFLESLNKELRALKEGENNEPTY